jgi:3-oxosteroid 1-dehydrogenase
VTGLPLAGCTFGWLHRAPLADALRALSRHGLRTIELTTAPPHVFTRHFDRYERLELARLLRRLGLQVVSVNPTFVDINLISTNPELRKASVRQLIAEIELAADLRAPYAVVVPGRRHQLAPVPGDAARAVLDDALARLTARAAELGVTIALENSPYGYLGTSAELLEVVRQWDTPSLRVTYDVANALAQEDPADGVARLAPYLALAHVSDTWRTRWAHTSVGRGDVDFAGFAAALALAGFTGPTVYELADGEDPVPRLKTDLAALEAAGWSSPQELPSSQKLLSSQESTMQRKVDVLVAGSGASGLTAAIAAAARGASVLLIERAASLGGTSALSGGRVWVPANHLPQNAGDSRDAARSYLGALFPRRYAHLTEAFIANAPAMARFVEENTPHRFVSCATYPDYHPDLPGATLGGRCLDMLPVDLSALTPMARLVRMPPGYVPMTHAEWERWRYPARFDRPLLRRRERDGIRTNGVALVAALLDGAATAGVSVEIEARLTDVTLDGNGAVVGAAVAQGGAITPVAAKAVIIATGGFDWDEALRATWLPGPQRATGAPPGNTGDALRIATRLGAATDNLAEGWWMPMLAVPGEEIDGRPSYRSLIRERAVPRQIMVNTAGRRFTDEASPYNDVGQALHRVDGHGCQNDPAYMIFDAEFLRRYPLPGVTPGAVPGWVASAGSPRGLADLIGVDPDGLERTVIRWNTACAEGVDPDFGRGGNPYDRYGGDPWSQPSPNLGPVADPPFYAVRVLAGTIGTKGGPVTDATGTVLTDRGGPIPGLYAVGNAAAFWTGDAYPAPGATLGIGMTIGYLAGGHAAIRREPGMAK